MEIKNMEKMCQRELQAKLKSLYYNLDRENSDCKKVELRDIIRKAEHRITELQRRQRFLKVPK